MVLTVRNERGLSTAMLKEVGMSSRPREQIPQVAKVRWTWAVMSRTYPETLKLKSRQLFHCKLT